MNIFGFEIKSKEEREQEEREYLHRIFPGGTAQKAAVEQQLREKLCDSSGGNYSVVCFLKVYQYRKTNSRLNRLLTDIIKSARV